MKAVDKPQVGIIEKDIGTIKKLNEISKLHKLLTDKNNEKETTEKSNSNEIDIKRLCRICLTTREKLLSSASEKHKNIPDMYFAVTSIKVDTKSQYEFKICDICNNDLNFFYDFKNKCIKADSIFKNLTGEAKANEDDSTGTVIRIDSETETEDEFEHEDVQYLDDTLDYDTVDDNEERISASIIKETETEKNKPKAKADTRRRYIRKKHQSYSCEMCTQKFVKMRTLKEHMKSEHFEQLPHACSKCLKSFSSEHDLQLHLLIHTSNKTDVLSCKECGKQFNGVHDSLCPSVCCMIVVSDRRQLKRHIERHMEVKRHACAACGKMFAELYSLRRHQRVHTGEVQQKPYACLHCDKRFRYRALLRAHAAQHSGARPCACSACGKTFASERLLASHRLVHLEDKPYKCHYCDKTFRHESTRNTHHRTHTGERPHVCARCGNTFIQRSNLVRHMRVHTGEKPYTCKVCDRKFGCGSSLKNHMSIHTGDKPYECKVCNKRFARSNLRLHMAMHTGERPHSCAVCGKRFVRAWALREHSRMHTGEKPFECAKCNDKFASKAQLLRHHRTQHEKEKLVEKVVQKPEISKPYVLPDKIVFSDDQIEKNEEQTAKGDKYVQNDLNTGSKIISPDDMPLEVTEEVILEDNGDKIESQNPETSQHSRDENVAESVNSNIHYVEMTDSGPNISSTIVEDGEIKIFQLDQITQRFIHRAGRELTVRKVTSTKTNF